MSNVDNLGVWEYLGTVTPNYTDFINYPTLSNSSQNVIRLTFYGDILNVKSFGYLQTSYQLPSVNYSSRWKRVYPSEVPQILSIDTPREILLLSENIPRKFSIRKKLKFPWYNHYGTILDEDWSMALEILDLIAIPDFETLTSSQILALLIGD